ncbi:MAG TPA: hypothetical protein VFM48_07735 [Aquabacterium sp.]|nr:hypothetical protein [Aquabacterium sp.]
MSFTEYLTLFGIGFLAGYAALLHIRLKSAENAIASLKKALSISDTNMGSLQRRTSGQYLALKTLASAVGFEWENGGWVRVASNGGKDA